MKHSPNPRIPTIPSPASAVHYGELTRENLRKFEQEQEERAALERKIKQRQQEGGRQVMITPPPPAAAGKNTHIHRRGHDQQQQQQHYVLDRVEDVDVIDEQAKYLCCCRCTHVHRGAWFVGLTQAVICMIAAIVVVVNYSRLGWNYLDHFAAVIAICVCYIGVLTFHFCGLQGKTACMLIPNLIAQFMTVILLIIACIILSLNLTSSDHSGLVIWAGWGPLNGDLAKEAGLSLFTVGLVLIGACAMAILLNIWFFYITSACYRYLNEHKRKHRGLVYNNNPVTSVTTTPLPIIYGRS